MKTLPHLVQVLSDMTENVYFWPKDVYIDGPFMSNLRSDHVLDSYFLNYILYTNVWLVTGVGYIQIYEVNHYTILYWYKDILFWAGGGGL